ncbi:MAG: PAS domain S-box protein [Desulfarculus sp.]|jgi:PAS domain S-box-containing protein|nr:MAG: PAS domain S-box protein [Desulfarculus sp.]
MAPKDDWQDELQFLQFLMNFLPLPAYFKDRQGRYQRVNAHFAQDIMGLSREQILGRKVFELPGSIPADLAQTYHHKDLELMQAGGDQVYQAEVLCADGVRRPFEFHKATVPGPDGQCLGIVGAMIDISDRLAMEQDNLRREKLLAAIQTAGAVCHELSQPLQVILAQAEMMQAEGETSARLRRSLVSIFASIDQIRGITDKLHNLSEFRTVQYVGSSEILSLKDSAP